MTRVQAPDRRQRPDDIENDAESTSSDSAREPDCETPLLATDLPPQVVPDKNFRRKVIFMCFVFIAFIEAYAFLTMGPIQEIMEDVICHSHFPDHMMNQPRILDLRCKEPDVQRVLAMVRSWWFSFELLVPFFVQIPGGIIADKYGRRLMLFLALFGIVLEGFWTITVLLNPGRFSIWAIIYGPLAFLIGGGPQMVIAMVYTIVADVVPAAERTSVFYQITAASVVLNAVFNIISAWLLSIDAWLPMWIGTTCMVLSTISSLFVPETLRLRKKADAMHRNGGSSPTDPLLPNEERAPAEQKSSFKDRMQKLSLGARENTKHIWRFVFGSKNVMLLVAAYGMSYPVRQAFETITLQYTTKRFGWDWSTATYFYTINKVTAVITLLAIIPLMSRQLTRRIGHNPLKRDVYFARGSVIFVVLACLSASFAYKPPIYVCSLIFYGLGGGLLPQIRALASGVVEPHTLATLNTIISTTEAFMGFISSPVFGWLLSRGIELGGAFLGLPFLVATGLALAICTAVWLFRIPRGFAQAHAT